MQQLTTIMNIAAPSVLSSLGYSDVIMTEVIGKKQFQGILSGIWDNSNGQPVIYLPEPGFVYNHYNTYWACENPALLRSTKANKQGTTMDLTLFE